MAQLEPKFLLKRIDYVDARFFPNLAEQNKIPIFSDISVVDLFSTLFASMAKLSQRGIDLKKEVSKVAGSREAVGANLDFTKTKKLEFESLISSENIKYPQLEEDYTRLNEIHNKKLKFIELSQRIETLSKQYNDKNKIKMVSQVEKARGIFSQFQFVQQVSSFIDMKDRTVAQKNSLLDLYQVLPDAQYEDIVNTVGSLVVQQRALRSLQKTLLSYPSELELFPIMGEVRKLKRSINDYWVAIKAIDIEYATVEIELNEIGCPYLRQGVCPAQKEVG
jgi:hypothetical protein